MFKIEDMSVIVFVFMDKFMGFFFVNNPILLYECEILVPILIYFAFSPPLFFFLTLGQFAHRSISICLNIRPIKEIKHKYAFIETQIIDIY